MGNNSSKSTSTSFPVRRWPTAGACKIEVLTNVDYVRQDLERWYQPASSNQWDATTLNEDVVYRFIERLWKHVEQIASDDTARQLQHSLQKAHDCIAPHSRGKPAKSERQRRNLRTDLMHFALEITGAVLVLQQQSTEGYQRRRQSLPMMAWAMIDSLVNSQASETEGDKTIAWCGGFIIRSADLGQWRWQRGLVHTNNRSIEALSEGEALLLLAVDLRKGTLGWDDEESGYGSLRVKDKNDSKVDVDDECRD